MCILDIIPTAQHKKLLSNINITINFLYHLKRFPNPPPDWLNLHLNWFLCIFNRYLKTTYYDYTLLYVLLAFVIHTFAYYTICILIFGKFNLLRRRAFREFSLCNDMYVHFYNYEAIDMYQTKIWNIGTYIKTQFFT